MDKHTIQVIIERSHMDADSPAQSYSGRGMFGKSCLGVVCSSPLSLVRDLLQNASDMDEVHEIAEALDGVRTDNMGRDTIVYFPGIEYVEEENEEDSE